MSLVKLNKKKTFFLVTDPSRISEKVIKREIISQGLNLLVLFHDDKDNKVPLEELRIYKKQIIKDIFIYFLEFSIEEPFKVTSKGKSIIFEIPLGNSKKIQFNELSSLDETIIYTRKNQILRCSNFKVKNNEISTWRLIHTWKKTFIDTINNDYYYY